LGKTDDCGDLLIILEISVEFFGCGSFECITFCFAFNDLLILLIVALFSWALGCIECVALDGVVLPLEGTCWLAPIWGPPFEELTSEIRACFSAVFVLNTLLSSNGFLALFGDSILPECSSSLLWSLVAISKFFLFFDGEFPGLLS